MGAVNTTYTFSTNDVITSTRMNNIIDDTTMTGDAIFGNTLEVASGKLKVRSQGITSTELAANAVTTTQILNSSITSQKLETNISIAGTLSVAGVSTFTGIPILSSGLTIGTAFFPIPDGSTPVHGARAWVNFNANSAGTFDGGGSIVSRPAGSTLCTVTTANDHNLITGHRIYMAATGITAGAFVITSTGNKTFTFTSTQTTVMTAAAVTFSLKLIEQSKNVSCVSSVGTGHFLVNLSIAMPSQNYCVIANSSEAGAPRCCGSPTTEQTAERFSLYVDTFDGSAVNQPTVTAVVFA
jgi:hypothetical protein